MLTAAQLPTAGKRPITQTRHHDPRSRNDASTPAVTDREKDLLSTHNNTSDCQVDSLNMDLKEFRDHYHIFI